MMQNLQYYSLKCFLIGVIVIPFVLKGQLNSVLEAWDKEPVLQHATISFHVLDLTNGETVTTHNASRAMIPASTLKILSTSAALSILTPTYQYETKLYFSGNFDKSTGILYGDLIIYGSGDPTLQSELFFKGPKNISQEWAILLKEKGLKEIKGQIIGDASAFERKVPDHWIWEDISNYYGAVPNGLSYCDNKFKVNFSSQEVGTVAKLISYSPTYFTQTLNIQTNVKAGINRDLAIAYGDPFSFNKDIKGSIPSHKSKFEIELALPDPALLCAEQLNTALNKSGIKCESNSVISNYTKTDLLKNAQLIHTHFSPSLDKIIYYTNQTSNNHYSESLLYTLGEGNADKGLQKVKMYWQNLGLDTAELYMEDASGLGRINTLTTHFQAEALFKISQNKKIYPAFRASLPMAGKQGSMRNIGKGTFIENNLLAKTGYMQRVRAYCGYVKCKSGKELCFSLMFNNYNGSAGDAKQHMETFLIALAEL